MTVVALQRLAAVYTSKKKVNAALVKLLAFVAGSVSTFVTANESTTEDEVAHGALLLLILWSVRALLAVTPSLIPTSLCLQLEGVVLARYTGTLSAVDRLGMALLVHLHNTTRTATTTTVVDAAPRRNRGATESAEDSIAPPITLLQWTACRLCRRSRAR